jgi:hypothetical protein
MTGPVVKIRSVIAGLALVVAAVAAMSPTPVRAQDAGASCARAAADDRVQPLPDALVGKARQVFEIPTATADSDVRSATTYRCMKGAVWLCNTGANLVCDKADVSRKSPGAEQFCKDNPNSADIPMSATGHATVYNWKCVGKTARVAGKITDVDARGFIAANWKQLK